MDDEPVALAWIGQDGEQGAQRVVVQDNADIPAEQGGAGQGQIKCGGLQQVDRVLVQPDFIACFVIMLEKEKKVLGSSGGSLSG